MHHCHRFQLNESLNSNSFVSAFLSIFMGARIRFAYEPQWYWHSCNSYRGNSLPSQRQSNRPWIIISVFSSSALIVCVYLNFQFDKFPTEWWRQKKTHWNVDVGFSELFKCPMAFEQSILSQPWWRCVYQQTAPHTLGEWTLMWPWIWQSTNAISKCYYMHAQNVNLQMKCIVVNHKGDRRTI